MNIQSYIDHTLLKADATQLQIEQLAAEAKLHQFYSVCVNGGWVALCKELLQGSSVKISVVCGFPLGANATKAKAYEAEQAVEEGADEIDMVLNVGKLIDGKYDQVQQDIHAVVQAVQNRAIVKVILETCLLNDEQKKMACQLSEQVGAHYVKTSTGFSSGGAVIADIALMRNAVSASIGVKASGGIRDRATALAMIEAGATRLGTSAGIAIVNNATSTNAY